MNNNLLKKISDGIITVITWIKIIWQEIPEDIKPGISIGAIIGLGIALIFYLKRKIFRK